MWGTARRIIIGAPLATQRMHLERVGILGGLAVFASDALSSVAYGPEEILHVLGPGGLDYVLPLAGAVVGLLAIVATSYRQTVIAYPSGGGAYAVTRDNLGTLAARVAGAALLVDYTLTVAVSVSAGTAAITSAWPGLLPVRIWMAAGAVLVITLLNLRGVRESATACAGPVYAFIAIVLGLVAVGLWKASQGTLGLAEVPPSVAQAAAPAAISFFLVLRAFASGCATLTGVEAVADGAEAFRQPSGGNAAKVLAILAATLGTMTVGIAILARLVQAHAHPDETVVSQIGRQVFGANAAYFVLQLLTAIILVLAANTSFAGFPRLAAFMAGDGNMPRQLANLGDRLVYSNGIIALAVGACVLIIGFGGEVTRLIPLYAVGVFTAFTLSQAGMVRHWKSHPEPGWQLRSMANGLGACVTGVVLLVVAVSKFTQGAWIVVFVVPAFVLVFRAIHSHYEDLTRRLTLDAAAETEGVQAPKSLNLLLVAKMDRGTLEGLRCLKTLDGPSRALHIGIADHDHTPLLEKWRQCEPDIPLVVVPSPYRNLVQPITDYINKARDEEGFQTIKVVIPEFIVERWWESLLHNHSALWLQLILRYVPGVATVHMRYRI